MAEPRVLTPERLAQIVDDVRHGVYDKVAAERAGIHQVTFRFWMVRGQGIAEKRAEAALHGMEAPPPSLYEDFYVQVTAARSEARQLAERRVFETDPKFWLTHAAGVRDDWRPTQRKTAQERADEAKAKQEAEAARLKALREAEQRKLADARAVVAGYANADEEQAAYFAADRRAEAAATLSGHKYHSDAWYASWSKWMEHFWGGAPAPMQEKGGATDN